MSEYIVTARKWRPTKFEDVVGQDHVTITLRNALNTGRLAHAYLFSGPRGVGKTTTARLLAKAVNCLHPDNANPDNTCENCQEVNEGRSFDVLEIDGASNRGVEEIRNLREAVRYAPSKGKRKVYIIDEVHMLTKEAFNALLKTLEEPPPLVLFIFATTELHKLPATILSRCQRFDFRRIPTEQIKKNLAAIAAAEHLVLDDEALLLIARKGDGSLRDAQSTFDMAISLCGTTVTHEEILRALNIVDQEMYFRVTSALETRNVAGALAIVQEVVSRGYDLKEFIGGLVEHFRNLLVIKAAGSAEIVEASDLYRQRYIETAGKFPLGDLLRCQKLVSNTDAALRWVANARFKLEADMVSLMTLPSSVEVGQVLRDLDELKKKESVETSPAAVASDPPVLDRRPAGHLSSPQVPAPGLSPRTTSPYRPPAEAPVAAPRTGSPNEGEVISRWKEYLDLVRQKWISLGSVMDATEPVSVDGNVVKVRCPDQFHADSISRKSKDLSDLFSEVFHVRARIEPVIGPSSEGGLNASTASPSEENPVVAALRRELGAEPLE